MAGLRALGGVNLNGQRATNAADASAATDLTTLQQLQAMVRGLDWKASVRAASTVNLTLSATQTVDGVVLVAGDRVLVKDQTTGSANGIYVVAAGAWTRDTDADASAEVTSGMATTVTEGTANGDKTFVLTTNDPITLGTTALVFSQLGGGSAAYLAGNGLSLTGQTFAVVAGSGIIADGTSTRVDTAVVTRKGAQDCAAATTTTIAHGWGTADILVQVRDTATNEIVYPDITITTTNIVVTFPTAPTAGAYRIIWHG